MSNEVKDFQPVQHGCKSTADHVIFSLACSKSSSLKGSYWGEDFTWALSGLCTVVVKLPVGSMRLYFVAGPRLIWSNWTVALSETMSLSLVITMRLLLVKTPRRTLSLLQRADMLNGS